VISGAQWLWLLVVPIVAMVLVAGCVCRACFGEMSQRYDVTEYTSRCRESGLSRANHALEHNVFSYFPFNVEMHYCWRCTFAAAVGGMYLAQLMHCASWTDGCRGVRDRANDRKPLAAIVAAIFTAMVPWTSMLASVAYNEGDCFCSGRLRSDGHCWRCDHSSA